VTNPAADMVFNIDVQRAGGGAWINIGTITVTTLGQVTLATAGGAQQAIHAGDRLRYVAPATADTAISGFATTLKGIIP
jgi:acyl dehydratase